MNPVEVVMELVLQEVDLILAWAFKVPGFRELNREDQASLVSTGIKSSFCLTNLFMDITCTTEEANSLPQARHPENYDLCAGSDLCKEKYRNLIPFFFL